MWVAFVSAKLSPSQCKGVVGGCQGIAMQLLRCSFSSLSMLLCGCYGDCLMVKSQKSFTLVPKYDSSSSREFYIFWSGVFFLQNSPSQCKLVVGCCWGVAKVFSYTDCLEVKVKRALLWCLNISRVLHFLTWCFFLAKLYVICCHGVAMQLLMCFVQHLACCYLVAMATAWGSKSKELYSGG